MTRQIKLAILLVAMTLALSGLARAQWDDDDDYYQHGNGAQARQSGYQNGYRDGVKQGRHEGRENDPEDFRVPDAGQASRGYRDWMGPIWMYQNAYRDGYRAGFRAGYNNESRAWGDRDGDSDDFPAVYSGGSYGGPLVGNPGFQNWFSNCACGGPGDAGRGKTDYTKPPRSLDDE